MPRALATPDYDLDAAEHRQRLGSLLRTLRLSTSRLSQVDVARHLRVTQNFISMVEAGERPLSETQLAAIDAILPTFKSARALLTRTPGSVTPFPQAAPLAVEPSSLDQLPDPCRVEEVAAYLRTGRGVIYESLRSGKLRGIRIGRLWRVPRSAVAALEQGR
jgi:excisionase family DNA binding protein